MSQGRTVTSVAVGALLFGSVASAAIKTETIDYRVGTTAMRGYLVYDDAVINKRPGVLVCHEWWGNNEFSQDRAKKLAAEGYVAFAVDMYGAGQITADPKQAGEWAGQLYADPQVVRDRAAAGLKILAEHKSTDPTKLAAIGFCMGGTVALELARSGAELDAVVCFHTSGLAAKVPADNAKIKARVLVCHGAADTLVKPEVLQEFGKQMEEAKIDYQVLFLGGAKHSFTNKESDKFGIPGVGYQEKAEQRSWMAMKQVFADTLGPVKN